MTDQIERGTNVVVAGRVGRVIREEKFGPAWGYVVQFAKRDFSDGTAPHWCQDWTVKRAELGKTICELPYLACFCGLVHVEKPEEYAS